MFIYSKSTLSDTLDLAKKLLFALDLFIQMFYIGYLLFRICMLSGTLILDIVLAAISTLYLIYYLINIREFYTKKHLKQKKLVSMCVKISKRLINIVVISIAVMNLHSNQDIGNMSILLTLLLIVGFFAAVLADIIVALIDQRKQLFIDAMSQDIEDFLHEYKIQIGIARPFLKLPTFEKPINIIEPKQLDKLDEIKLKYEQKKRRKDDFSHKKQQH